MINNPLFLSILYYILLLPFDSITYIKWINTLFQYKWLASAIIFPFTNIIFFGLITLWFKLNNKLNINNINQKTLFYIGFLDCISAITSSIALPYISLIISLILSKLSVPITMILSYYLLDKKYYINHYISVGLVLLGILIALIPYIHTDTNSNIYAILLYIISIIPNSLSNIYLEKVLKIQPDIDLFWLNTYISIWQFGVGLLTIPIIFITNSYNINSFIEYFENGMKCQFMMQNNQCSLSFLWLIIYQFINIGTNILSFVIIKHGSSLVLLLLTTIKTPLTCIFGYLLINFNIISIPETQNINLSIYNYISISIIIIAILIYNYKIDYIKKYTLDNELLYSYSQL